MPESSPLITVSQFPFNAETPPANLADPVTPVGAFFVRNHFAMPGIKAAEWRLSINGLVESPLSLSLAEIQALPTTEVRVTLECAGNGRRSLSPLPEGVAWGYGAAATATFTGAPLKNACWSNSPTRIPCCRRATSMESIRPAGCSRI